MDVLTMQELKREQFLAGIYSQPYWYSMPGNRRQHNDVLIETDAVYDFLPQLLRGLVARGFEFVTDTRQPCEPFEACCTRMGPYKYLVCWVEWSEWGNWVDGVE